MTALESAPRPAPPTVVARPFDRRWLLAALGLVIALAASRIWLIPAHFSTDVDEGWNAYQAIHAMGGGRLYPPVHSTTGNNYPPLSFYIVGELSRLIGDPIVAGRLISFLSMLVVAGAIHRIIRCFSGTERWPADIGALLFLGFNATLFRNYLAMDDPQWLGHALMSWGLVLLLTDRPDMMPSRNRVIASSLLMFLGGMVKHNLVAFPLAALLWLVWRDRRLAATWLAAAAIWAASATLICFAAYGPDIFAALFEQPRHYSIIRMIMRSLAVVPFLLPMLAVVWSLRRWREADLRVDLILLTIAVSVPFGILQRAGQGVDLNAHFDSLIAICIGSGVALSMPAKQGASWRIMAWLFVPFLILVPIAIKRDFVDITESHRDEAAWRSMESKIARVPGKVACEDIAMCFWAKKDFAVDFFLYGQRAAADPQVRQQIGQSLSSLSAIELEPRRAKPRTGEIDNPVIDYAGQHYLRVFQDRMGQQLLLVIRSPHGGDPKNHPMVHRHA